MASNRRRSLRKLSNYVNRIDKRTKRLARRPAPTKIADRSVTTEIIDVNAVTTVELAPGAVDTDNIADGAIDLDKIDGATQDQLGGIDSTTSSTAPTSPAEGDFWIDTSDNNNLKRYNGTAWVSVRDLTIATAQSAANAAQTTANGKNRVFRQTSAPTADAVGDLWFDTDDDNRIYRWDGSSWVANNLGNNAIASLSANKITAGTIDASVITVSNINAGNISTGTLSASRIAAGSLDASKITAGTITSTQIASSYVYAGSISAGQITAGTMSADRISGGTITGVTISGVTVSGSTISGGSISIGSGPGFAVTGDGSMFGRNVEIAAGFRYRCSGTFNATTSTTTARVANPGGAEALASTASKREYKYNIEDITGATDILKSVRPRMFNWNLEVFDTLDPWTREPWTAQAKELNEFNKTYGFIAEEMAEDQPRLTVYEPPQNDIPADQPGGLYDLTAWKPAMWKDMEFIPLLVKAVQELSDRLDTLEGRQV